MLYQYNPLRRPYLQIDMLERPADYLTDWHRHDFFHLIYVFSGDLARLLDYIDQHLTEPQTLDSLAAAMNLSASHLERLCYGHFDMGAKALYNRRRFEHAASLLTDESMSIQEISDAMGFTEPSNFTNFFKRYADCSPIVYRKRYLNL